MGLLEEMACDLHVTVMWCTLERGFPCMTSEVVTRRRMVCNTFSSSTLESIRTFKVATIVSTLFYIRQHTTTTTRITTTTTITTTGLQIGMEKLFELIVPSSGSTGYMTTITITTTTTGASYLPMQGLGVGMQLLRYMKVL